MAIGLSTRTRIRYEIEPIRRVGLGPFSPYKGVQQAPNGSHTPPSHGTVSIEAAINRETTDIMMTGSSTGDGNSELSPPKAAADSVKCEGVEFTVTERNEVAEVARGGGGAAPRRACWTARASLTRARARGTTSWTCRGRPRRCCSGCPCARTSAASSPSRGVVNY